MSTTADIVIEARISEGDLKTVWDQLDATTRSITESVDTKTIVDQFDAAARGLAESFDMKTLCDQLDATARGVTESVDMKTIVDQFDAAARGLGLAADVCSETATVFDEMLAAGLLPAPLRLTDLRAFDSPPVFRAPIVGLPPRPYEIVEPDPEPPVRRSIVRKEVTRRIGFSK